MFLFLCWLLAPITLQLIIFFTKSCTEYNFPHGLSTPRLPHSVRLSGNSSISILVYARDPSGIYVLYLVLNALQPAAYESIRVCIHSIEMNPRCVVRGILHACRCNNAPWCRARAWTSVAIARTNTTTWLFAQ